MAYVIPLIVVLSPLIMRVSSEILLAARLPFSVGGNLAIVRRDGRYPWHCMMRYSVVLLVMNATQRYFPLFQLCSIVIFWHKTTLVFSRVTHHLPFPTPVGNKILQPCWCAPFVKVKFLRTGSQRFETKASSRNSSSLSRHLRVLGW